MNSFIYKLDTKITSFWVQPQNGNITDMTCIGNQIIICTDKGHVEIFDLLLDKSVGSFLCNYDMNGIYSKQLIDIITNYFREPRFDPERRVPVPVL